MQEFLQRVYDNGDIELGSYEGLYCVGCELYYNEDELDDGQRCPIHGTVVEHVTEENYFFRLSRYEDRLLAHYAEHPEAVQPAGKRNEVLGLIKQGLLDFSISRTSISWGIPLPWDERHVAYVWFDALINYCTAVGYPDDRERFDRYWPANYHLIGKDILRQHAVYWPAMLMAAGEAPPKSRVRARLPPRRRREDEQDARSTRSRPPTSSPSSASTASATTSSPTSASVPTATSATRRWWRATTPTSPTTSATSPTACSTWRSTTATAWCPTRAPTARSSSRRPPRSARSPRGIEELDYASGFGAVWDLIRDTNSYIEEQQPWALHKAGDAAAVAAVLGDCLEALRSSRCSRRR